MATRNDFEDWIIEALHYFNGSGWPKDVAKYIWDHYEDELRQSGSLLYTWQYDIRWAVKKLRNKGVLKPVYGRRDLPWELV